MAHASGSRKPGGCVTRLDSSRSDAAGGSLMPHRKVARAVWHNLAVIALLIAAGVMLAGYIANEHRAEETRNLAVQNRTRVKEIRQNQLLIQQSRVESCQRTYEGVRQVFQPFLRPHPRGEEARRIARFNERIDMLKLGCVTQTKPGGVS